MIGPRPATRAGRDVAGSALAHTTGEFTVTVGFGLTVSVPLPGTDAQLGLLLSLTTTL